MGQGEAAEQPAEEASGEGVATAGGTTDAETENGRELKEARGNGVVVVDFSDLGPQAA